MTTIASNNVVQITRVVGNREALGFALQDVEGNAIDLTGKSVTFRMVLLAGGTVKVNDQACTVTDAAAGEVAYTPAAADVNTAGLYAIYLQDDSSPPRRWPYDGARMLLRLVAEKDR